jgi:hypothetical protein
MDTGVTAAPSADATAANDKSRLLAALAVGCFWIVPIIGPLVLRAFTGKRPFALHYFRLAMVIQVVFVIGVGFSAISNIWPDTSLWTGVISIPAWLWAVYGSVVCLLAALRGERRGLRPIPRSWIWAPAR